jgi:hypothetical protein
LAQAGTPDAVAGTRLRFPQCGHGTMFATMSSR